MQKKNLFLTMIFMAIALAGLNAQEQATGIVAGAAGFSVGVEMLDRAGSLGFGVNVTSPYYLEEHMAIRVRGEMVLDSINWNTLFLAKAGLVGVSGTIGTNIRLYGEGGVLFVFPTADVSSEVFFFGGYGHFGFEFLTDPFATSHMGYFIEIGATGVTCTANQYAGSPLLINGFAVGAGMRFYFF